MVATHSAMAWASTARLELWKTARFTLFFAPHIQHVIYMYIYIYIYIYIYRYINIYIRTVMDATHSAIACASTVRLELWKTARKTS